MKLEPGQYVVSRNLNGPWVIMNVLEDEVELAIPYLDTEREVLTTIGYARLPLRSVYLKEMD